MDVTIRITEQDIMGHPDIIDGVKALGLMLAETDKPASMPEQAKTPQAITKAVETPAAYAKEDQTDTEEDKSEPKEEEETQFTPEEVRAALAKVSKAKGKEVVKELLGSFDAKKFSDVDPQKYGPLMEAIKAVK